MIRALLLVLLVSLCSTTAKAFVPFHFARVMMTSSGRDDETPVDWKAEFGTVRSESNRILGDLRGMTKNSDWEGLKAATKDADLTFRKKEMGGLRKKFPKELKDEGIMMCNAVTFDLIAISKAARGQDMARAEEVIGILETDFNSFLNLEGALVK